MGSKNTSALPTLPIRAVRPQRCTKALKQPNRRAQSDLEALGSKGANLVGWKIIPALFCVFFQINFQEVIKCVLCSFVFLIDI